MTWFTQLKKKFLVKNSFGKKILGEKNSLVERKLL